MESIQNIRDILNIYFRSGAADLDFENILGRVTHLGIGAHPDDLEIMCPHGICSCYGDDDKWFAGIVCTNGSGSLPAGKYGNKSIEEIKDVRWKEQRLSARIGDYLAVLQFDLASDEIKKDNEDFEKGLRKLLQLIRPEVIYTHNPADKHETHVAVVIKTIKALRSMEKELRPSKLYGCEVWRGLDWMDEKDKVALDVSGFEEKIEEMIKVHTSQISEGKRYDLATLGRMRANATYHDSHSIDPKTHISYAMDLTPLIRDDSLDLWEYLNLHVTNFFSDIKNKVMFCQ